MPFGVFLDAVRAKRRIDRYRHRTGQKNSRVGNEECARSRQHQRHAASCRHSSPRQFFGKPFGRGIQLGEGQREFFLSVRTILANQQMRLLAVVRGAVAKHVEKRLGGKHVRADRVTVKLLGCRRNPQRGGRLHDPFGCFRHRKNRPHQISRRVRFRGEAVRQA